MRKVQTHFIAELRQHGNVRRAAHASGRSHWFFYNLRKNDPAFAAQWAAARVGRSPRHQPAGASEGTTAMKIPKLRVLRSCRIEGRNYQPGDVIERRRTTLSHRFVLRLISDGKVEAA